MEEHVLALLASTQSSEAGPRQSAEIQLQQLQSDKSFPPALISISVHNLVPINQRQAALNCLKIFVSKWWLSSLEGNRGLEPRVDNTTKDQIRDALLAIVINDTADSKITTAASNVVSRIAAIDFPEAWPNLLTDLLAQAPQSTDQQLHGVLVLLIDLLREAVDDNTFTQHGRNMLIVLHNIAVDDARKPQLRALAISAFLSCIDSIETTRAMNKSASRQLMQEVVEMWLPFLGGYLKLDMPLVPTREDDIVENQIAVSWRGVTMLKIQVVKTLERLSKSFDDRMDQYSWDLFIAAWGALQAHAQAYRTMYTEVDDRQGSLTDVDGLQYTFDFLVLEELDYVQTLIKSDPVKGSLNRELETVDPFDQNNSNWVTQVIAKLIDYICISAEAEASWESDINDFLTEETSVTESYNVRSASANFVRDLARWLPQYLVATVLLAVKMLICKPDPDWRSKESVLFLLQQVFEEVYFHDTADPSLAGSILDHIRLLLTGGNDILRARSHLVMSCLTTSSGEAVFGIALEYSEISVRAILEDSSDLVKVASIRAMQNYLQAIPSPAGLEIQVKTMNAISSFLETQDLDELKESEELSATLAETLRDAIAVDPVMSLQRDALRLLFTIIQYNTSNLQTSEMASEGFSLIIEAMSQQGPARYAELCRTVVPILMSAIDVASMQSNDELCGLAMEMVEKLTDNAINGLPENYVSMVMPKVIGLIYNDKASDVHDTATVILSLILSRDSVQLFNYQDRSSGRSGLEILLLTIGHLLDPRVDDRSAAEVGRLAVEVVEKADAQSMRHMMPQILKITAQRLNTAQHDPLIQSLTSVFAHLAMVDAQQMLDFLESIQIEDEDGVNALEVVLRKWLQGSENFTGIKSVQKNIVALGNIYKLHDPRLANLQIIGDLVVENTSRIKTRSMSKEDPDKYQKVSMQLKLLKVLVSEIPPELSPPNSPDKAFSGGEATQRRDSDDDDEDGSWESDEDEVHDLASLASRQRLMGRPGTPFASRQYDKETLDLLIDFFRHVGQDPDFNTMYGLLNEQEKNKLASLQRVAISPSQLPGNSTIKA